MKKIEMAYLLAVGTLLLVIFTLSLARYSELAGVWHESPATASMGKPRTVNVEQLRLLLKQGKLADQEAKFYTTSPTIEEQPPALPNKK